MNDVIYPAMVSGVVRLYQVSPVDTYRKRPDRSPNGYFLLYRGLWVPAGPPGYNDALYEWGTIMQNLVRGEPDGKPYKLSRMYIEFDNSGSDVDPVPTIARNENLAVYYNTLNTNFPNRDYLRVALIASEEDTSNPTNFPQNNIARFFAQTSGTTGVHGLTFADTSNSKVYGGALVASPDDGDSSKDLVFSRFYKSTGSQVDKVAGSQIGLTWDVIFN